MGMMELWLLIGIARLSVFLPFEGYLPYDSTGDWFFQFTECATVFLTCLILFQCRVWFPRTRSQHNDGFPHRSLILLAGAGACVVHPNLNGYLPSDICYAFAVYLEAIASLPQLYIFQREQKLLPWTAHFLGVQALARTFSLMFWCGSYSELHDVEPPSPGEMSSENHQRMHAKYWGHPLAQVPGYNMVRASVGYWILGVQGFQMLLMGDFAQQYLKCLKNGEAVSFVMADI